MDEITLFTILKPDAPEFAETERGEVLARLLTAAAGEHAAREQVFADTSGPGRPDRARRSPGWLGIAAAAAARRSGVVHRRLLLAGLSALAAAAAVAVLVISVIAPGAGPRPSRALATVAEVRAAILDAYQRGSGDMVYVTRTIRNVTGPVESQRIWTYPVVPVPGEQVRIREFDYQNGVPVEDTESSYIAGASSTASCGRTTAGRTSRRSSTSSTPPTRGPVK